MAQPSHELVPPIENASLEPCDYVLTHRIEHVNYRIYSHASPHLEMLMLLNLKNAMLDSCFKYVWVLKVKVIQKYSKCNRIT